MLSVAAEREGRHSRVVVPDDQLSLAIGNKGQNVRLAAKLTGWRIDIKPESEGELYTEDEKPAKTAMAAAFAEALSETGEPLDETSEQSGTEDDENNGNRYETELI